jgi:ATP-dependent DNA helicase RecQ
MQASPLEILTQYWGHQEFRTLQPEIINSVLEGNDTLALLPTGGGKSICFQVPALIKPGLCLVISPLIALMKDQVENLRNRNIPAAAVYSGMRKEEMELVMNNAVNGAYKFLYLSPERLHTEYARDKILQMKINLLAIDEAHCISQWGYDFRPEYLKIAEIRPLMPGIAMLALTATATAKVISDIQDKLSFKKQNVFRKSFERKNLAYLVRHTEDKDNKLLDICRKAGGTGVIYAASRRQTQDIARFLVQNGVSAAFYHAGLSSRDRNSMQEKWIRDKIRVIVCTNAFGMGIDKPDVRFVVHYQMANSLEAYYQEAGRAGRDGERAWCVVLHHIHDDANALQLLQQKYSDKETLRTIYDQVCNFLRVGTGEGADQCFDFDLKEFCKKYKWNALIVSSALTQLEKNGLLKGSMGLFTPSRVMITAHREDLKKFQEKFPENDLVIKSMLRTYGGIFDFYTSINENEIASRIPGMNADAVSECLQKLHDLKYIHYEKQHDQPQVMLISDRLPASHIEINEKEMEFLKSMELGKLEKAIEYAGQETKCRSQVLLSYFDEKDSKPCGSCDICIRNRKKEMSPVLFRSIFEAVEKELQNSPLTLPALIKKVNGIKKQDLTDTITYLLSQDILEYNKNNELVLV